MNVSKLFPDAIAQVPKSTKAANLKVVHPKARCLFAEPQICPISENGRDAITSAQKTSLWGHGTAQRTASQQVPMSIRSPSVF